MKTTPLIHLVRLARRLNAKAAAAEPSSFPASLEDIKALGEFGYKILLLLGIGSAICYLFYSIHYYPPGVTIGDSFFFLLIACAFGFAYLIFIAFGFIVAVMVSFLLKQKWRWLFIVIGTVGAALWVYPWSHPDALKIFKGIIGFGVAGFCLFKLIKILDRPPGSAKLPPLSVKMFWIGLFIAPVFLSFDFLMIFNERYVMGGAGLRANDVTIKLSEENYNMLASAVGGRHLPVLGCSTANGGPERLVHGVSLLWHGIGERTLVGVPIDAENMVQVELKREGVAFVRNYGPSERCFELSGDLIFLHGSDELADLDEKTEAPNTGTDLDEMMKIIVEKFDIIQEIRIVGHADAIGYPGGAAKNNELAKKRARAIKSRIETYLKTKPPTKSIPENFFTVEGHGAREPKTLCKDWPVKATLSECLAVNRRVEVKIKFTKKGKASPSHALPPEQTKA